MIAGAATQPRDEAIATYVDYMAQLTDVMGDVSVPGKSSFSWPVLYDKIDDLNFANGTPVDRIEILDLIDNATVNLPDDRGTCFMYDTAGSFVTVNAHGTPLLASRVTNPRVPVKHGCNDPYPFLKIGAAFLVEGSTHQGADWGDGYKEYTSILRELGTLGTDELPFIGMASLHEIDYNPDFPDAIRGLRLVTGASGRTLTDDLKFELARYGVLAAVPKPEEPIDLMAGWLDTQSAIVANRLVNFSLLNDSVSLHSGNNRVEWPDPLHEDNLGVNWN